MDFEPLGFENLVMVGWQSSEKAEYAICPHLHPGIFELHLVVRGQLSYLVDGHYHTLCGGDLLLIQPDAPHGTLEEPLSRCERYWLQVRAPQPGQSLLGLSPEESQQVSQQLRMVSTRPFRCGAAHIPLFERIRLRYQDENAPLRVVNLRNLILRAVLDFVELARPSADSNSNAGIQKAVRLIEESQATVSLAEMAKVAAMSESAFKLLFKKQTGLPPLKYVTRHRIENARRLLHTTSQSITEIAHTLGFSSSQYFATVFQSYTGQSPNEFRSGTAAAHWDRKPVAGAGAEFATLVQLRR
jgi:AraC-like DNA-binding protein